MTKRSGFRMETSEKEIHRAAEGERKVVSPVGLVVTLVVVECRMLHTLSKKDVLSQNHYTSSQTKSSEQRADRHGILGFVGGFKKSKTMNRAKKVRRNHVFRTI